MKKMPIAVDPYVPHYALQRPVDWNGQFTRKAPLTVEIGFGLGEYLVRAALDDPDRNYIGIEDDWRRVKKALKKIQFEKRIARLDNLRILQIDATVAFERLFAPKSIEQIYCLFPCPWPKTHHVKHRLFSGPFFRLMNSRLAEQGEIRIVTDYLPFYEWMQEQVAGCGFYSRQNRLRPQFNTKYERKWMAEGQREFYELRLVKEQHMEVPQKEDAEVKVYFADNFFPEKFQFEDLTGEISIILKDFIFDRDRGKGMVHLVVAESTITQHVWVTIVKCARGWCIAKAEGHTSLPTSGVALSIKRVAQAVKQTQAGQTSQI